MHNHDLLQTLQDIISYNNNNTFIHECIMDINKLALTYIVTGMIVCPSLVEEKAIARACAKKTANDRTLFRAA